MLFDIGQEIDLSEAKARLSALASRQQFRLRRPAKSVLIDEAPLVVPLAPISVLGMPFGQNIQCMAKIWNYGALSITFAIEIPNPISFQALTEVAIELEHSSAIQEAARSHATKLMEDLGSAIKQPELSRPIEDYIIYLYRPSSYEDLESQIPELLDNDYFYQLMLTDKSLVSSKQTRESMKSQVVRYSTNDFVLIDWNSAFICSEGDSADICDVIEFALCQLLELQYYDELLDKKLSHLYRSIQIPGSFVYNSPYTRFSKEAALIYIEISEIVEKVENALKVIGDFYYARVFRLSLERFRIKDWQQSVDKKLNNLAEVAMLFQNEVNAKRALLMESTIIALIAIEVIPLLVSAAQTLIGSGNP